MKNSFYLIIILSFFVTSCRQVDESSLESKELTQFEFQGKITDIEFTEMSLNSDSDWLDYDAFYLEKLPLRQEEHFYDNLQWTLISQMIQRTDFLENAPKSKKLYYLEELMSRNFINEPEVAVKLLLDEEITLQQNEIAEYARLIYTTNRAHYKDDALWKKHEERNMKSYVVVHRLGWNRWGRPL